MDGFRRAHINTGLAINAHILVNLCFFILQRDRGRRTFIYTRFAPGTFCDINNCYQIIHSIYYFVKYKK